MISKISAEFPVLAEEWSSENPGSLDDYKPQSNKKFLWVCSANAKHKWNATLQSRTKYGSGCPYCSKQKVLPEGSFAATEPAIEYWHPTKNAVDPFTLSPGSTAKRHWWRCKLNSEHEWQTTVASVVGGSGCPHCAGQKVTKNESFGAIHPELLKYWHPTRNKKTPYEYTSKSEKNVWWVCEHNPNHEWEAFVATITKGGRCPYCAGKRVLREESFGVRYPKLLKEWHPTKNSKLDPFKLTTGSAKQAWWICAKNRSHEFKQPIHQRTSSEGHCPFCIGKRLTKERSLAIVNPYLASQWHNRNLPKTPEDVFASSNKIYWWQCEKHQDHDWRASPNDRMQGRGCPFCSGQRVHKTNSLATLEPRIAAEWHPTRNGKAKPEDYTS